MRNLEIRYMHEYIDNTKLMIWVIRDFGILKLADELEKNWIIK